jgi:hypothetical protein
MQKLDDNNKKSSYLDRIKDTLDQEQTSQLVDQILSVVDEYVGLSVDFLEMRVTLRYW